jgi:UPF0716 protein FxsA
MLRWLGIAALFLVVAEIFALAAVSSAIGWPQALLLMLATSLLGIAVLRHPGRARINRMQEAVAQKGIGGLQAGGDAFLTVTAGVLLLIPGFMTDAAGVLLLVPPVRRWIGERFLRFVRTSTGTPDVVDLKEDEWKQVPEPRLSDRRPPNEPS